MDELGWDWGRGWRFTPLPMRGVYDVYQMTHESGYTTEVEVDSRMASYFHAGRAIQLIDEAINKAEVIMFGGGDVRPKPDGA